MHNHIAMCICAYMYTCIYVQVLQSKSASGLGKLHFSAMDQKRHLTDLLSVVLMTLKDVKIHPVLIP